MQAIEAIPLFRTRPGIASVCAAKEAPAATFSLTFEPDPAPIAEPTDPAPLPPLRKHTGKPALPADRWVDGIATLPEALRLQKALSAQHATACGLDGETGRYYVRGYGWQWAPI